MNHTQLALPTDVRVEEIARERTLGSAIGLCLKVAGFDMDKQLLNTLKVDKAQFSRWQAGTEGIIWDKFSRLMDACGNDAPLLWMAHQRGYDVAAMRKRESELQRENRLLKEQVEALTKVLRA